MGTLRKLAQTVAEIAQTQKNALHDEMSVARIGELVKRLTSQELGLVEEEYTRRRPPHTVEYLDVGETDLFTMCVFVLPPSTRLPTHDHPNMTVFSKVLFGELEIESYNLLEAVKEPPRPRFPGMPRMAAEALVEPNKTDILRSGEMRTLSPLRGNVHSFRARQWTAVFDLVMPPYDPEAGRPCNYFDTSNVSQQGSALRLREINCPDSYYTERGEYRGERIS